MSKASATQGSSCSGVARAGEFAAGGTKETVSKPHAGSRDAGGEKRPRQAPSKDTLISQNLALLAASNPSGWMDAESILRPPQRTAQTHTDSEAGEILKMRLELPWSIRRECHDQTLWYAQARHRPVERRYRRRDGYDGVSAVHAAPASEDSGAKTEAVGGLGRSQHGAGAC